MCITSGPSCDFHSGVKEKKRLKFGISEDFGKMLADETSPQWIDFFVLLLLASYDFFWGPRVSL